MKSILYCGLRWNYANPIDGDSYEFFNFQSGLIKYCYDNHIQLTCWHPDYYTFDKNELINRVVNHEFDLIFNFAFNDQYDLPENIANTAIKLDIPVLEWQSDSSWRFNDWILPRKNRVSYFITTHSATIPWYQQNGMKVIKSQWAISPLYEKKNLPKKYDITTFCQKHGQLNNGKFVRSEIINAILAAGLKIDIWGNYWEGYESCWHGYEKDFSKMIEILNKTKIGLNISNPWHTGTMPQLKGRLWELNGLGVCQITTPAYDLESYYEPGKEILVANSENEIIDFCKYYLKNEHERQKIADAAFNRTIKDHQWSNRFDHIFKEVGLI